MPLFLLTISIFLVFELFYLQTAIDQLPLPPQVLFQVPEALLPLLPVWVPV